MKRTIIRGGEITVRSAMEDMEIIGARVIVDAVGRFRTDAEAESALEELGCARLHFRNCRVLTIAEHAEEQMEEALERAKQKPHQYQALSTLGKLKHQIKVRWILLKGAIT